MRAFSLVELVVVMAIVAMALMAAWPAMSRFQIDAQINESLAALSMDLRLAASDSRSAWQDDVYGLKFFEDYYTVYRGESYVTRKSEFDRLVSLPRTLDFQLELGTIEDEISFNRRGLPEAFGSVTIGRSGEVGKTLLINKLGVIEK